MKPSLDKVSRSRRHWWLVRTAPILLLASLVVSGEAPAAATGRDKAPAGTADTTEDGETIEVPRSYRLGTGDEIRVWVLEAGEIPSDPIQVGVDGEIRLPLAGEVQAAGRTPGQLEHIIAEALKEYLHEPRVAVGVVGLRSQPVSVIGAVRHPGQIQLDGQTSLVEALSRAGGLLAEAGETAKITRRREWGPIPLEGTREDPGGQHTVAEVNLKRVMEARDATLNILLRPHDVISVPRAERMYVIGAVRSPGGFALNGRQQISVLKALALAGGMEKTARPRHARILRASEDLPERVEEPINLKEILLGQATDIALGREDILFIPTSKGKVAAIEAANALTRIGVGIAIFSNR